MQLFAVFRRRVVREADPYICKQIRRGRELQAIFQMDTKILAFATKFAIIIR
jgi:hypothetical protein